MQADCEPPANPIDIVSSAAGLGDVPSDYEEFIVCQLTGRMAEY
jgi:hypothetical protein